MDIPNLPKTAKAGPEMEALARFYWDAHWIGHIRPGGMGPGSPEMGGEGRAICRRIQDGLWFVCDFQQEQRLTDGTFVLTWRLHWITGWDPAVGEYRAVCADNNGPTMALYRGRIEGDQLMYEPLADELPRIRLTWLLLDADHLHWRNEITIDGLTWSLIEEYDMVRDGADRAAPLQPRLKAVASA
jgi:hypothetical protein